MKRRIRLGMLAVMFMVWQTLYIFPQCDLGFAQESSGMSENMDSNAEGSRSSVVSSVIYPFRSATVGSEVRGILDAIKYKEGDPVVDGAVVAEVSKDRYTSIVGEFRSNYEAIVRTLDRAREQAAIQEELYRGRAGTFDDVMKVRSEVRILEARKEEAAFKLKQAELNLRACEVRSPFSGVISVLYHEPYETVDNLEKVFGVVDTTKVYARAYWPEARLSEIALGKKTQLRVQRQSVLRGGREGFKPYRPLLTDQAHSRAHRQFRRSAPSGNVRGIELGGPDARLPE